MHLRIVKVIDKEKIVTLVGRKYTLKWKIWRLEEIWVKSNLISDFKECWFYGSKCFFGFSIRRIFKISSSFLNIKLTDRVTS